MLRSAPGLTYFKEKTGFVPYRVKWAWRQDEGA